MKLKFEKFKIPQFDGQGKRYFLNAINRIEDYIDYDIKKIYFLTEIKGETGAHCHYEEKELFILINGSCTITINQGSGLEEIKMEPNHAFYVGNLVWHHFKDFSDGAVLLALSSTGYKEDRSDYLEDYDEYTQKLKELEIV